MPLEWSFETKNEASSICPQVIRVCSNARALFCISDCPIRLVVQFGGIFEAAARLIRGCATYACRSYSSASSSSQRRMHSRSWRG